MAALGAVLHGLRRSLDRDVPDGELVDGFVARRDEVAFEALVRRHGPMVLGVCRRVLGNDADVEDAFQATFLVLVRKAATIRPRGMVGNWLYGVAHTTALKARAMNSKRQARERAAARSSAAAGETWDELQSLLDQELKGLPDPYRCAIILCDLEGKSIKDAAKQLGCPQGTVGTRLARGRRLLARRLARRGVALSGGALAAVIAQNTAAAGVPPLLMNSTLKIATAGGASLKVAALTEGVLQAMLLSKLKTTSAVLVLVAAFGVGVGAIGDEPRRGGADQPAKTPAVGISGRAIRPAGFEPREQKADPADEAALKKASVDGKYSILLKKIEVKEDRDTYTDFHDFGKYPATSYAGHDNLPAGFWVYVAPHWYIWERQNAKPEGDEKKAMVDGKYSVLLRKIEVEKDRNMYKDFHDYGYWTGTGWGGHTDLPPGYWVYVAPNWYIWGAAKGEKKKVAPPAKDAPAKTASRDWPRKLTAKERLSTEVQKKASVDGKYSRLLKTIEVPDDKVQYGEFNDYGYAPAQSYAGHANLPAGYWVYAAPNWYIWGTVKEK